jgi:hypothetical protein
MAEIFLSYRRSDAAGAAGRLADRLKLRLGDEAVFRDLDSISAGADFEEAIRDAMRRSSLVLVVIGPRWLDARDADGRLRLHDPKDYVRLEVEAALALDVPIIPLLVEGATMPKPSELPESLAPLAVRNAYELSERRWSDDAEKLAELLADRLGVTPAPMTPVAKGLRGAAAALTGYLPDLVRLLRGPKRFIGSRNGGRYADLVGAFTFWAVSIALGHVLILLDWPRKSPAWELTAFGLGAGLVATLALSAPLWLAWWLLGARRHYSRVLVPLAYQLSVLFLSFAVGGTLLLFAFDIHEAGQLERTRDALLGTVGLNERLLAAQALLQPLMNTPEVLRILPLCCGVQVAVVAWLLLAWGAYRHSLGASRLRSLAAFFLFIVIACVLFTALAEFTGSFEARALRTPVAQPQGT